MAGVTVSLCHVLDFFLLPLFELGLGLGGVLVGTVMDDDEQYPIRHVGTQSCGGEGFLFDLLAPECLARAWVLLP